MATVCNRSKLDKRFDWRSKALSDQLSYERPEADIDAILCPP